MSDIENATQYGVAQFFGLEVFEHYEEGGALLVVTSDASALRLEPGDFIVKRLWSTAVTPYVYNRANPTPLPEERDPAAVAARGGVRETEETQ